MYSSEHVEGWYKPRLNNRIVGWLWLYIEILLVVIVNNCWCHSVFVFFILPWIVWYSAFIFFWNAVFSLYNCPLLINKIFSYYIIAGMGICLAHFSLPHPPQCSCSCSKCLEYFLFCTFWETSNIVVGFFYIVITIINVILSTYSIKSQTKKSLKVFKTFLQNLCAIMVVMSK